MTDLYLFYWVLCLFGRGVGTSPKALADCTGCTRYRARQIFKQLLQYEWVVRKGNTYHFKSRTNLTHAMIETLYAWRSL